MLHTSSRGKSWLPGCENLLSWVLTPEIQTLVILIQNQVDMSHCVDDIQLVFMEKEQLKARLVCVNFMFSGKFSSF